MRLKKTIGILLAAALLIALAPFVLADGEPVSLVAADAPGEENAQQEIPIAPLPRGYSPVSGTVRAVEAFVMGDEEVPGSYYVLIEGDEGALCRFLITPESCDLTGVVPAEGDHFTGWFDLSRPVIMIYPPQYAAVAYAVNLDEMYSVMVAYFDETLLSVDGALKLNVGETTAVFHANGDPFTGELGNLPLAVLYSVTTRSLPPQTAPDKIFVLEAFDPSAPAEETPEAPPADGPVTLLVDGTAIDAPDTYYKGLTLMVPLRAVCEAMGFEVSWIHETKTVEFGPGYSLSIGKDEYIVGRRAPLSLGDAPELTNGHTYVPMRYFSEVLGRDDVTIQMP